MDRVLLNMLESVKLGETQYHKGVTVFPIFSKLDGELKYLTLKQAIDDEMLIISEVSDSGSVPLLKAANRGKVPVLLLDGEEVRGAKQNRILNTTILIGAHDEVLIPVSCTEQGRWSYESQTFRNSDTFLSKKIRTSKNQAVTISLERDMSYVSDQSAIWSEIDLMAEKAKARSSTGAMNDIFEAKESDLKSYEDTFVCVESQKGLLVGVGGKIIGCDMVSSSHAYSKLHNKLIKSYVIDSMLDSKKSVNKVSLQKAENFITDLMDCSTQLYKSVGLGEDCRINSKKIVGSALLHRDTVIHLASFSKEESQVEFDQGGRMSDFRRRKSYRLETED